MRQIKRLGGDSRIGKYTEWNKNGESYCIYCGHIADTREHVPSKVFLLEPYPENLPTIPACTKCNNGFSTDEVYVASYINMLKGKLDGRFLNEKIRKALSHDKKLKELLDMQIREAGNEIHFSYDGDRFRNILIKLAIGHIGFEFDYVDLECEPNLWYDWSFNLDENQVANFNSVPCLNLMPEIGSRVFSRLAVAINPKTDEPIHFLDWVEVQTDMYYYLVYYDENQNPSVKISIGGLLFCIVTFN